MKKDDLEVFYKNISEALKIEETNEKFTKYFYNSFLAGDTTIYQRNIAEFKNFDNEWIEKLEEYFPSLDKILRNPKSTLRYDEEITIIEKAKKVTSQSIRHLAANSHLIKEVHENGDITPNKILTTNPEIEYGIYENRFIMTLIQRLATFVGNRYEVIKSNIQSFQRRHLNLNSNFDINNNNINLNIDMVVRSEVDDSDLKERNNKLFARVTKLYKTVHGYMISPFMRELAGKKPVLPPIMKTNIILKNPDFRNAYDLWLFLDKYNALVYDIDVQERDMRLDADYIADLNQLSLLTYAYILYNQEDRKSEYASEDMIQYVRKATKIVKTNPKDMVDNPDAIAMEDNTINEYYLDQNQKIFKKSLVDLLGDNISYEDALKTAMKQTMDITNSLYKSVFDLNPDLKNESDLFKKRDINFELDEAKKKAEIAKIVRETKEEDYKQSIDLEKEQLKTINELNKELIKSNSVKKKKTKDKVEKETIELEQDKLKTAKEIAADKKKKVLESIEQLSKIKKNLYEEQKRITNELQSVVDKELIAAERERARLERQETLARLKEERRLALERERALFREARDKLRAKYRDLQQQIIENEKANRQLEIDRLQEQFRIRREQELEKIRLRMQG